MSSPAVDTSIPGVSSTPGVTSLPPTSTPPPPPTSTTPTPTPTSTTPTPTPTPTSTSTSTAPSAPASTQIVTSVVSVPATDGNSQALSTVIVTRISTPSELPTSSSSTRSGIASGASNTASASSSGGGGLSPAGTIAIAVVIPVVVVALLVFGGLFWWRRRKQRKVDEDERRKEMEAYGFNPNHDPTLPVVGGMTDSGDEQSGYRGWGSGTAAGTMSNRKASTTLSSGNGNPAAYSPGSPNANTDASGEPLVGGGAAGAGAGLAGAAVAGAAMSHSHSQSQHSRNTTLDSDRMGPEYAAGGMHSGKGVQRGPSNASSTYSMGESHASDNAPIPVNSNEQYYSDYYQQGPYDNAYGQEAVIRDNPARRNTRIERAPTFPNQGSSGVATNF